MAKLYCVEVKNIVETYAFVTVEAETPDEAEDAAIQRADEAHDVEWEADLDPCGFVNETEAVAVQELKPSEVLAQKVDLYEAQLRAAGIEPAKVGWVPESAFVQSEKGREALAGNGGGNDVH